jgi:hypothetical protein
MSKSRDYTFYKSEELYDWGGNVLPRNLCDKLQVGDIVRLCLEYPNGCWQKFYFEIIKIDFYKYGNTSKPRKFHGKVLDIYCISPDHDWNVISPDHITTFRKEDILELPGWNNGFNPLTQPNLKIINRERHKQSVINYHRSNDEFNKIQNKKNKLNQIIKDFRDKLNAKYPNPNLDSNDNLYSIKKLRNYLLKELELQDSQLKDLDWKGLEELYVISNVSEENICKILDNYENKNLLT